MLNGKSILITGGTGSFGKKFIEIVLKKYPNVKKLVVFSRDELKQFEMSQIFSEEKYPAMRYFLGDIRDLNRLKLACEDIDIIVHAAALKQVPAAEYNPFEFIKTNVIGAQNLVDACLATHVNTLVALSTDKAAAPINLYGATKLCSDKLFVSANNICGKRDLKFSVVRYGNVLGSRGSVVPFFMNKRSEGVLPITDSQMTRFNITLEAGVEMVLFAIKNAIGGEIFVPKIPSYKIMDMAEAIAPSSKTKNVGIRPGEKLHEEMITEHDAFYTIDMGDYYAILPSTSPFTKAQFMEHHKGKEVAQGFQYNSGTNTEWMSVEDIRGQIKQYVDSTFQPL